MKRTLLLVSFLAFGALSAFAVDGQTLLNQSTIMAAGGFPYKINQGGSFKLSGNLIPPGSGAAIDIEADNVTIDLNGFTIFGLSGSPGTAGIIVDGVHALLTNGVIDGFASPYKGNATDVTLQNVRSNVPVNGPTFLDQAKLNAAGGSLTISQSGTYKFAGDITGAGTNCGLAPCLFLVTAPNVTLDLAGFTLLMPGLNVIPILQDPAATNLVIRHGSIVITNPGFAIASTSGFPPAYLPYFLVLEDLTLISGGNLVGFLELSPPYRVDRVFAPTFDFNAVASGCPGLLSNSVFNHIGHPCTSSSNSSAI